jgi:hypothetical protein
LKFTSLRKHINFSNAKDPLFYDLIALNEGVDKKYKSLRSFISPNEEYKGRMKIAHQFLLNFSQIVNQDPHRSRSKTLSRNE